MTYKDLLKRLLWLFIPVLLPILVVRIWNPTYKYDLETDYIASIIDKQAMLENAKSPKIVLLGGSSVAYGVCSDSIEKATGLPTYNMAIIYSFGLDFMLKQVDKSLKKGDVLVISPEFIMDTKGNNEDKLKALKYYPKAIEFIEKRNYLSELSQFLTHGIDYFKYNVGNFLNGSKKPSFKVEDTTSVFFRRGFNQKGDLISHLNNSIPSEKQKSNEPPIYIYDGIVDKLNKYNDSLKIRGVKLYYTYPPYMKSAFDAHQNHLLFLNDYIVNNAQFTRLDSLDSNVRDDSYFHDQQYHLNAKGREIHSSVLAKKLEKALKRRMFDAF